MRYVVIAAIVGRALLAGGFAAAQPAALDEVDESVVRVAGESGTGSGSVVAPGRVLTNWHVVDGQGTLAVVSAHTGSERRARVIWSSEALDLAVLAVDGLALPAATLGTMALRPRERVWALGYPGVADQISAAHDVTSTEGVISRLHTAPWDPPGGRALEIVQHSADINPGNSGGPLVNDCGVVIGVNTAAFPSAQGTFLASRITEAARELRRLGIRFETTDRACAGTAARAAADADTARGDAARAAADAGTARGDAAAAVAAAAAAADAAGAVGDEAAAAAVAADRAVWLALAVGAVALPALLLALRRPRREIVRVVERVSRSLRSPRRGAPPASATAAPPPGPCRPRRPSRRPASRCCSSPPPGTRRQASRSGTSASGAPPAGSWSAATRRWSMGSWPTPRSPGATPASRATAAGSTSRISTPATAPASTARRSSRSRRGPSRRATRSGSARQRRSRCRTCAADQTNRQGTTMKRRSREIRTRRDREHGRADRRPQHLGHPAALQDFVDGLSARTGIGAGSNDDAPEAFLLVLGAASRMSWRARGAAGDRADHGQPRLSGRGGPDGSGGGIVRGPQGRPRVHGPGEQRPLPVVDQSFLERVASAGRGELVLDASGASTVNRLLWLM